MGRDGRLTQLGEEEGETEAANLNIEEAAVGVTEEAVEEKAKEI